MYSNISYNRNEGLISGVDTIFFWGEGSSKELLKIRILLYKRTTLCHRITVYNDVVFIVYTQLILQLIRIRKFTYIYL